MLELQPAEDIRANTTVSLPPPVLCANRSTRLWLLPVGFFILAPPLSSGCCKVSHRKLRPLCYLPWQQLVLFQGIKME